MSRFLIVPDRQNKNLSICIMTFNNEDYICRASKNPIYFDAEPKFANLISGKEQFIKTELERSETIDIFYKQLNDLILQLNPVIKRDQNNISTSYYKRVIQDINAIGWDEITRVDVTLSNFDVVFLDEFKRKIEFRFDLPSTFPYTAPVVTTNLPITLNYDWDSQTSKLSSIIDQYKQELPKLNKLWVQLEDLDKNTIVIDPHVPTLNCCMRLIYINPQIWVQIEVRPNRPDFCPIVKFKGSEKVKSEFQHRFDENVSQWDIKKSIRENLQNIIGVEFAKKTVNESQIEIECPICFCERFGGELPDIVCENPSCAKHYHKSCLLDWLRENRKLESTSHYIFGTCPNCGTKIHVNNY